MEWFRELQAAQQAEYRDWLPDRAAWLRELDAVYLYGTIGSQAVLLADGTVRLWVAEQWPDSEVETGRDAAPEERIGALVIGAEKYPVLRELLPLRPPDATTCSICAGSGYLSGTTVICTECSGLGWVSRAT
jgi:hypothetical protein